jgi:hypothetical protein
VGGEGCRKTTPSPAKPHIPPWDLTGHAVSVHISRGIQYRKKHLIMPLQVYFKIFYIHIQRCGKKIGDMCTKDQKNC